MVATARHPQQSKTLRKLAGAQTLSGLGVTGTFAAGSLLVVQISGSEALAGLVQTSTVVGAALLALPAAAKSFFSLLVLLLWSGRLQQPVSERPQALLPRLRLQHHSFACPRC